MSRFLLLLALGLYGCGSDDPERRPDTGYGADLTPPATMNCFDLCERLGDCAERLCNEDTNSTRYSGIGSLLASECEATCSEAALRAELTDQQWQCSFQSSCRQVFDYDVCGAQGHYFCR